MSLPDLITPDSVVLLKSETKRSALEELVAEVPEGACALSPADILEKLLAREELMSTGIGLGLGIPHIRTAEIHKPVLRIGIQPAGISDYAAIDEVPVQILFMILMNEKQQREHLALLSEIVRLMKKEGLHDSLVKAETAADAAAVLLSMLS